MRGRCPACGAPDPGFDWITCPNCGSPEPGAGQPSAPRPSEASNPSRWDPTEFGSGRVDAPRGRRAVFDDAPNYYQDLPQQRGDPHLQWPIGANDRWESDDALFDLPDATEYGDGGGQPDHTIFDRGGRSSDSEDDDSDHTVIVRGGRKGVTGPLVYFVERTGMRAGKVWQVGESTLIGRRRTDDDDEASIIINDETVSRRHGKVIVEDGAFLYWDLASANGSFVVRPDGSRTRILEPHRLADGDTIDVGEARLTFLIVDPTGVTGDFE